MDEIDALLDALWKAAVDGDTEAAIFLQMFAPWAAEQANREVGLDERRIRLRLH
jgi:hypothetical protein